MSTTSPKFRSAGSRRRGIRALGSCAAALALAGSAAFLGAAPAHAGTTKSVDFTTKDTGSGDGKARAHGVVTFHGKYRATVDLSARDICEKDGRGAYVVVVARYQIDGKNTYHYDSRIGSGFFVKDNNGCGNGSVSVVPRTVRAPDGMKLIHVGIELLELDEGRGSTQPGDYAKRIKDNPYSIQHG